MLAKVGAIATIVFGFGFLPQVVLFVGQMLVSDGALDYFGTTPTCSGRCPWPSALLAVYYAALGVAVASLTSRRIVGGRRAPRASLLVRVGALGRSSSSSDADGHGPCGSSTSWPSPCYLRDLVFLGHIDRDAELGGVEGGGLLAVVDYLVVVLAALGLLLLRYREPDA